ncbi:hypothetical protein YTPLAS73_01820 [Nitrosarchaeum sp.]|nr:hypothetical protein YTPLAS73_01820 [Nitrosarchaeum sp.]
MTHALKFVFSNYVYVVFASAIFIIMLFGLLVLSEYVFLEPYVIGHIAPGMELGFTLIVILTTLSAMVIPMNIYRINILKKSKRKVTGSVFGSFVGSIAGACSCGPIGFAIFSTFGSVGAIGLAFLTNYEFPIRIAAIALLAVTYFTTVKSLKTECKII